MFEPWNHNQAIGVPYLISVIQRELFEMGQWSAWNMIGEGSMLGGMRCLTL